jgi:hypothetical protein
MLHFSSIENDFLTWKEKMWPAILDYYGIDLANLTYVLFFLVLHEYVRDFWSEQVLFTSDFAGSIIAMDSCGKSPDLPSLTM